MKILVVLIVLIVSSLNHIDTKSQQDTVKVDTTKVIQVQQQDVYKQHITHIDSLLIKKKRKIKDDK